MQLKSHIHREDEQEDTNNEFWSTFPNRIYSQTCVQRDHPWDPKIVPVVDRWS